METHDAIEQRRSIRRYQDRVVSEDDIRAILRAATLAPSGKNTQPWRFVVVQGDEKRAEMVALMRQGIEMRVARGIDPGSSRRTAGIMARAPVTIFVFDGQVSVDRNEPSSIGDLMDIVDIQSIGAAVQNMLLAALDRGLGTLWICDIFYAQEELCEWLGERHLLVAAVSLGYPDEAPGPRPRKSVDEVTTWF